MSSSSRSDGDNNSCLDVEELLQIGNRYKELRKEKDLFMESQTQGFDLIKRLEVHVKALSESRIEDRKLIQKLETELLNCSQEIDFLQDQLNARNPEVYSLGEHVHDLELKLADMEHLEVMVGQLREELKRSGSENLLLMQKLDNKEVELQESALYIEELQDSVSSVALDSQCEIESMRFAITALEQTFFETRKIQEETTQEKEGMIGLIKQLEVRIISAEEIIEHLEKENKELKKKLLKSETDSRICIKKVEEFLESKDRALVSNRTSSSQMECKSNASEESNTLEEVLGLLFLKLEMALAPRPDLNERMESRSHQISEYEALVNQLKEELREERLKAKEEAEDLAQEMAELRYQMTSLLEEECKRRACIEQASLQRISELEAQIRKERRKCCAAPRHLHEELELTALGSCG